MLLHLYPPGKYCEKTLLIKIMTTTYAIKFPFYIPLSTFPFLLSTFYFLLSTFGFLLSTHFPKTISSGSSFFFIAGS